jgi:hypothetical protein
MKAERHQPRNYSKAAFVLAAGALLISAAHAGGPALASAMAGNSDTVDGFHAVKAGSSVKQRKGKLVATDAKTGRLPNNIIKIARDSKRLGGKPASSYLGSADAAATYETTAHAQATYETAAHAAVTYESAAHAAATYATYAEAAASADRLLLVTGEAVTPPTAPGRRGTAFSRVFTLPRPGSLLLRTALQLRVTCSASSAGAGWLTVDDVYVTGSLFLFPAGAPLTTAVLSGVTASSQPAGEHTVTVWAGCTDANLNLTEFFYPSYVHVTSLGSEPSVP